MILYSILSPQINCPVLCGNPLQQRRIQFHLHWPSCQLNRPKTLFAEELHPLSGWLRHITCMTDMESFCNHGPTGWRDTNHGLNLPSLTPLSPLSVSKTCGILQRASHAWQPETQAILAPQSQPSLHDKPQLLQSHLKRCLVQEKTQPKYFCCSQALSIPRHGYNLPVAKTNNLESIYHCPCWSVYKFTRIIRSSKTTAPNTAYIFSNHLIVPYKIPQMFLKKYGPQIVTKFFETFRGFLGVKQVKLRVKHNTTTKLSMRACAITMRNTSAIGTY